MKHAFWMVAAGVLLLARGAAADHDESPAKPAPPVDVPGFWTDDELRRIDQGLDVLNVTRKDLGFQKRPIEDPFRLDVVNQILDDPLAIGQVAAEWDAVARSPRCLHDLLARAQATLASPGRADILPSRSNVDPTDVEPAFPKTVGLAVLRLAADALSAKSDLGRVFVSLQEGDRAAFLRKTLLSQVEHPKEPPEAPDIDDARFLELMQQTSLSLAQRWGATLAADVAETVAALRTLTPDDLRAFPERLETTTSVGRLVFYGVGDDIHGPEDDDAVLVIDLGGNDTCTRGASANLLSNKPVSILIDVAGEDRYIGQNDFSFGGALGGVAIQWDCAGNDTYIAGNVSCGAGILGVGVLVDEGGNDVYRCKDFCEGAGAFGIGLLLDKSGNDFFHADLYGQGYGSTWGCGMLVELAGNDVYDAGGAHVDTPLWRDRYQSLSQGFGFGNRPDASGGVGVLVDVSGNDRYSCDIFGQGCSYWFSLGLLIDDDGHDTYACGQYGQGSGIHLSCGMLLDRHGQDNYYDANGVGMGGAHDWAVGFLVDREGDDYYSGGGCAQGSGHTNSVGMLIDDAGDDGYCTVRGTSQGDASFVRNTGGIGLLLDGAGKDFYSETTRDDRVHVQGTIGASLDEPTPPEKPSANPMNAAISKEDAEKKVVADGQTDGKWDLDKLWKLVTQWEVGDNTVILPIARERFFALGSPALDRAFDNLNARDSLITRAIDLTMKEFAKTDRTAIVQRLLDKSRDADEYARRNSVAMLAALESKEALPRLTEMLTTEADNLVAGPAVLAALATLKTAPAQVVALLKAPKERVAVQAAVCLGAVGDEDSVMALVTALGPDYEFPVRLAAADRLAALGAAAVPMLTQVAAAPVAPAPGAPPMQRRNALRALGGTKSVDACDPLAKALADADPLVRLSAMSASAELVKSLSAAAGLWLSAALEKARAAETDPLVKRLAAGAAGR